MAHQIFNLPPQQPLTAAGRILSGAKAYFYLTDSVTPTPAYTTHELSTTHAVPVEADAGGRFPTIYLDPLITYKVTITDANDVLLYTIDPATDAVLTQESIGALLYPITPAETAATVTPSNYAYPPGDVRRYGAVGSGDESTEIQQAFDVAAAGFGRVHFPCIHDNSQTVYQCSSIDVGADTHVTADDGVIIESTQAGAFDNIFKCISTMGTETALTANAAKGATSVAVTSASGLSVGQIVIIRDATYKFSSSGRNLELNEIASIASLTITLKNRLIGAYTTAATAELVPATTAVRRVKFENVKCRIPTAGKGGAFYFQEAYDCDVINCGATGMEDQGGVQTWRAAYIRVIGGSYTDGVDQSNPGEGYGINFGEASHHCTATNVFTRNVRENAVALNARFCKFVNCICVSPYDNGFNSHANGAEDCEFINCEVYSARQYGFVAGFTTSNAADKRIRFINCKSYDSGSYAFWSGADSSRENEDIEFIDCVAVRPGVSTATNYGFLVGRGTRPKLINCRVMGGSNSNVRAGALIENCTNAVWSGGEIMDVTSGWGIIHDNCTGITIERLHIRNIAGGTQGVHATGTPSTKVIVKDCRVDNDVAFSRVTGDVHTDNVFNTKWQNLQNQVATSIADGGTVTHNLIGTPAAITVTAVTSGEFVAVTAKSSTTFTCAIKKHDGTAGTTQNLYWSAGL